MRANREREREEKEVRGFKPKKEEEENLDVLRRSVASVDFGL